MLLFWRIRPPSTGSSPRARTIKIRATPAARRSARENSIELAAVQTATGCKVVSEELVMQFLKHLKEGTT